ncbi:hypothetical protein [Gimibacter soli]|uniref:Glycogen debranching enzyme n=1 Tax=Gimibacter soli TaxID=3024400 RepID=A0AAE9XSA1_9PROT|nr:hypothetical protein [Gimibacter soli]WCL55264.1 hypothetical protein PH603_05775 [Gimibacter soli]
MRLAISLVAALGLATATMADEFSVLEGNADNAFISEGQVTGHLLLTSGLEPRIIVAFPAGNSGAGIFLAKPQRLVHFTRTHALEALTETDATGITARFSADAPALTIARADLGSLRFVRGAVNPASIAPRGEARPVINGSSIRWQRERADGKSRYEMRLTLANGTITETPEGIVLAGDGNRLDLTLTALTGDTPLTPIRGGDLLTDKAADDPRLKNALGFLATREKLMAGSWRFLTYFGRDTLLSVRLLLPVLGHPTIEAVLGSVIERLNTNGEVAHEEAIGELAVLMNLKESGSASSRPVNDYGMIDDNLMLLPVLADYLDRLTDAEANAFLARATTSGERYGDALARNASFVLATAQPFAAEPMTTNLIALHAGELDGNWRDSEEGLGHGRYPYDVNAVLMPAALEAIARLQARGLIDGPSGEATRFAAIWRREAVKPFMVTTTDTRKKIEAYAHETGVPATLPDGDFSFHALALDADGKPIPVQHSDDGFDLLFGAPDAERLSTAIAVLERPFPAGLLSPVGMFVANAAFADDATRPLFGPGHYHGAVVWSWQQAMWAVGLRRQIERDDLSATLKGRLGALECQLWQAIDAGRDIRNSELWSWSYADGEYRVTPFGQSAGHQTESNAVQLWSSVYLAVTPPATCQK